LGRNGTDGAIDVQGIAGKLVKLYPASPALLVEHVLSEVPDSPLRQGEVGKISLGRLSDASARKHQNESARLPVTTDSAVAKATDVYSAEGREEVVLFLASSGEYLGLEGAAAVLWHHLENSPTTVRIGDVVGRLGEKYQAEPGSSLTEVVLDGVELLLACGALRWVETSGIER
jgi:hypothetical protein